jgi:nucleoside-diphosphate-sugar epimerase
MRVLVTGAAGFIGSHLADQLLEDGHDVVGLDGFIDYYPRAQKEQNLLSARAHPKYKFHEVDLRSDSLSSAIEGVDAVVHEAAMPGLPRSWTEFDSYETNNLRATQRLLEACVQSRVKRFMHISTSSVYGRFATGDEQTPTRPVSPYGVTKLAAEHLALAYMANSTLDVVILRYFSVYGPRQRPDMAYHIFAEALLDGRPLTVFGDGQQTRSSTYVEDCVRGTIDALDGARPGNVYNIGGAESITLLEAIDLLAGALGVTPTIRFEPARPGDQQDTRADTRKAAADFGYRATISPQQGIPLQCAWHIGRRSGAS